MDKPKPPAASLVVTSDEIMNRTFVTDPKGNVYSLPIGPEHNAALEAGLKPEGFELVFAASNINPKYGHLLAGAGILFQMCEAAKVMLEAHGEHLQGVGTPALMQVGTQFEAMAANINLAQRQAIEGLAAMVAQTQKYQK